MEEIWLNLGTKIYHILNEVKKSNFQLNWTVYDATEHPKKIFWKFLEPSQYINRYYCK